MASLDLNELRTSLDNLDTALLYILAERFHTTRKIGLYKKEHDLPPVDCEREAALLARIEALAHTCELNGLFIRAIFRGILDEVVREHEQVHGKL